MLLFLASMEKIQLKIAEPTTMMLHIKFDCDRPTGLRDIHLWNCGRRTDGWTPDHGNPISSPCEPSAQVS